MQFMTVLESAGQFLKSEQSFRSWPSFKIYTLGYSLFEKLRQ